MMLIRTLDALIQAQDVRQLIEERDSDDRYQIIYVLRRQVEEFIRQFNLLNFQQTSLPAYLDDTEKILIGASLICEDGIKIYDKANRRTLIAPSVNSIKAGFLIFKIGSNSILARSRTLSP